MSRRGYAAAVAALVLSLSLTACGTAANSGDPTASRTGTGNSGPDQRSARSAYDYLEDGRYSADANGRVYGSRNDNMGRDLTQGARDLIRGAGDAIGDVGRGIGDAARDITGGTAGTPSWEPNPGNRSTMNY